MMVILKGAALRRIDISLLETGWHPKTAPTTSLCTRNPTPYSCLPSSPLKYTLCPSSVDISPKFFQRISQSPTMFQWYLLIAWVSCSSFPAGLRVLTFNVPTAMFSLPLIFMIFGTPVAYLSPTSRCLTVGAVIVIPGCDRSGIRVLLVFIFMVCLGQSSAWRSPSLSRLFILTTAEIHDYCMARFGHEHMAVDSKSSSALAVDFF